MNWSLDLGMMSTIGFRSPPDRAPNYRNPPNAVPNLSPQIPILRTDMEQQRLQGDNRIKVSIRLPKPRPDHAGLDSSTNPRTYPFFSMRFLRKKTINSSRPSKSLHNACSYRIDRKVMGAKWSRALALLLHKEEWGLLEGLVLEVLEERLRYSVT
jgi:hypothetical protein